ncbi:MAG: YjgP/YjgQ family permease, partial [Parabacteroides sp.]
KGAVQIATLLEEIVEELANSEHILLLNKLMDYPFLNGYSKRREAIPQGLNLVIALLLPVGLTYYLFEMYNRKLLIHDIGVVQKVNNEVKQIIIENIQAK